MVVPRRGWWSGGGGGAGGSQADKAAGSNEQRAAEAESQQPAEMMAYDGQPGKKAWPDYIVFFGQLEPVLRDVLGSPADDNESGGSAVKSWVRRWLGRAVGNMGGERGAYRECWRGWNGWGHEDWRRRGGVRVWCLR